MITEHYSYLKNEKKSIILIGGEGYIGTVVKNFFKKILKFIQLITLFIIKNLKRLKKIKI